MLKTVMFALLASVAAFSIGRMSLEHLRLYGLIVAIPFTIYAARLVFTLAREEMNE